MLTYPLFSDRRSYVVIIFTYINITILLRNRFWEGFQSPCSNKQSIISGKGQNKKFAKKKETRTIAASEKRRNMKISTVRWLGVSFLSKATSTVIIPEKGKPACVASSGWTSYKFSKLIASLIQAVLLV